MCARHIFVLHDIIYVSHDMCARHVFVPHDTICAPHDMNTPTHDMSFLLTRTLGAFHSRVMRRIEIDLSHHDLPGLHKPIEFLFLDPLYAWSVCAHKLGRAGHKLHFAYQAHTHPDTGEPLYGASVASGEIMRKASARGFPALFGISYDAGQASRRRSYAPILISVANTDFNGRDVCICIGYMPGLQLASSADTDSAKTAMHELRQACIGAIVDVLEAAGRFGFKCVLSEKAPDGKGYSTTCTHPMTCTP